MRFISVDLPEPDGPMIATYSLRRMARSTPRSARTISPPMSYSRLMPRVTMTQSLSGAAPGSPTTAWRSAVVLERSTSFERAELTTSSPLSLPASCRRRLASRTSAPSLSSRIAW